ncbi:MAG TPA: hypothetical protein VIY48_05995 [Candidatus Paceibacterota bacterium]
MTPEHRPEDSIEQSFCRQRTDEEQRAIEMCTVVRTLIGAGAREIRLDPRHKTFDLD